MDKPADADYPIHDLLRRRWSPRSFSKQPVEKETLRTLFEAARWAPSSFNEQPWSFVIATKDEPGSYEAVLSLLTEGNRRWAHAAPVLGLSIAKLFFEHNGKPNRHAFHDVGLAVANLVVEATDLGLSVHQMAGFSRVRAQDVLEIPDNHEPVAMIAIGYPGDPSALPEDLQKKEFATRTRKRINEFVFSGRWGTEASLLRGPAGPDYIDDTE